MDVNLNLYKYFIAVMEQHSVTRAAHYLGVSQPTVTYNLQELERAVQAPLFTVGRHGIQPLPLAEKLYRAVKSPYAQLLAQIAAVTGL